MDDNFAIQLFEGKRVRIVWDAEQEKYYFSIVDSNTLRKCAHVIRN